MPLALKKKKKKVLIAKRVQVEKSLVQAEIGRTNVPTKTHRNRTPLDETAQIHLLVGQYLAHDGYVETARAFAEDVIEEARALANDEGADLAYMEVEEDLDAINRQSTYRVFPDPLA